MKIPIRHKLYFLLAFFHIATVMLFAAHFAESTLIKTLPGKLLSTLGFYTGSNNIFSFFAPGLSDQPYVIYTIGYKSGREEIVDLKGTSPDFSNRVNNIYGYLTMKEGREIFSACLAQSMFLKYPSAKRVRVAMVIQFIPTMEEYRKGGKSTWRFWFHYDYENEQMVPQKKPE